MIRRLLSARLLLCLAPVPIRTAAQANPAASGPQGMQVLNHIIFMAQENRGLDHYFGTLRQYWRQIHNPDISFDGLPQLNPPSGQPPLLGPSPTQQGCDPAFPPPND